MTLAKDAMQITDAAGMRLRLRGEGTGEVECRTCGIRFDVVLQVWVALPARERGCPWCSVERAT